MIDFNIPKSDPFNNLWQTDTQTTVIERSLNGESRIMLTHVEQYIADKDKLTITFYFVSGRTYDMKFTLKNKMDNFLKEFVKQ